MPIVSQTPASFGVEGIEGLDLEAIVLEKAHWAASAIMAYAFDVDRLGRDVDEDGYQSDESDEDLPKAMVPLADMLNADADLNNVRLESPLTRNVLICCRRSCSMKGMCLR